MTRAEYEKALTDAVRQIAPVDPKLGRRTLRASEVNLLFQLAGLFHARETEAQAPPPPDSGERRPALASRGPQAHGPEGDPRPLPQQLDSEGLGSPGGRLVQ